MRKVIVFLMLLTSTLFFAQEDQSSIQWETNFELAKEKAKQENKSILLMFTGSDWCPPCKKLKREFFNAKKFEAYANKFIFVYVNFPRNKELVTPETAVQNKELNTIYGIKSLPTILIVNYKGKKLDKIKGYNSAGDTEPHYNFLDRNL